MSDELEKESRAVVYPYNRKKADALIEALRSRSLSDMVNYLIETASVDQITEITFTNQTTHRSFVTRRRTGGDPLTRDYRP